MQKEKETILDDILLKSDEVVDHMMLAYDDDIMDFVKEMVDLYNPEVWDTLTNPEKLFLSHRLNIEYKKRTPRSFAASVTPETKKRLTNAGIYTETVNPPPLPYIRPFSMEEVRKSNEEPRKYVTNVEKNRFLKGPIPSPEKFQAMKETLNGPILQSQLLLQKKAKELLSPSGKTPLVREELISYPIVFFTNNDYPTIFLVNTMHSHFSKKKIMEEHPQFSSPNGEFMIRILRSKVASNSLCGIERESIAVEKMKNFPKSISSIQVQLDPFLIDLPILEYLINSEICDQDVTKEESSELLLSPEFQGDVQLLDMLQNPSEEKCQIQLCNHENPYYKNKQYSTRMDSNDLSMPENGKLIIAGFANIHGSILVDMINKSMNFFDPSFPLLEMITYLIRVNDKRFEEPIFAIYERIKNIKVLYLSEIIFLCRVMGFANIIIDEFSCDQPVFDDGNAFLEMITNPKQIRGGSKKKKNKKKRVGSRKRSMKKTKRKRRV